MNCAPDAHRWEWVNESGGVTTYYCKDCAEIKQEYIDGIGG
jgi:hypothetical protein